MAHNNSGHAVNDIYRSVINDVIAQVKEAFLDENIDIDVLNQLKREWEEKIAQSGCVDMDPKPMAPTNSMRAVNASAGVQQQPVMVHRPQPQPAPQHIQIQPTTQQLLAQQQRMIQQQQLGQQQQLAQQQAQVAAARQQQLLQAQAQAVQVQQQQHQPQFQSIHPLPLQMQMPNMQQYMQQARVLPVPQYAGLVQPHSINMPQNIMVLSGGQRISMPISALQQQTMVLQQQQLQNAQDHVHQLDGNGVLRDDVPCSSVSLKDLKVGKKKMRKPSRKEAEKVARKLGILQLDGGRAGGGGGMSDSSSEEEEEEEDDPLRRIADRIGDEGEDLDGDGAHEDPLNSDDDQSDDEDLVTLFDSEDVVMCQFEKVSRARSKWKFALKDGIMHINGKDFCFQKCTGEAEW
ncbi:hypothetical protein PFISCL1PPCAC_809 [Pristionchus fissidentatus]|uniref:Uncharacterized protein n=1 Tax=Pristionchus fissidentatus TaxID=1538716 RepID=A0AAV5USG6_9BILA|nr:hypothetical protein PFISCL1PPCAC_809 [Pristionchus fissidentatus]